MPEENLINYFGEGPDEGPAPQSAGDEPANPQTPATQQEKPINPRLQRAEWFLGI